MRRISGGAVWSNRPRTDLARAPVEKSAGATLRASNGISLQPVDIIRKMSTSIKQFHREDSFIESCMCIKIEKFIPT